MRQDVKLILFVFIVFFVGALDPCTPSLPFELIPKAGITYLDLVWWWKHLPNLYNPVIRSPDLDGNGRVDFRDLAIFANQWLTETKKNKRADAGGLSNKPPARAATTAGHFFTSASSEYYYCNIKLSKNLAYNMSSFFPWMGGKSKVAKRLCQLLPEHKCYVEVFAGAANLLFVKDKSSVEVINDINAELVNLFRVVRSHRREFMRELMLVPQSRNVFADYRLQPGLTDIQRAARSYFIMKAAFGGKGGTSHPDYGYGTTGRARFCRKMFSAVNRCHKRLDGVYIENLPFEDCIKRYDRQHTVFYCDPPYLDVGGYKKLFHPADHERLAAILTGIKGKFLLTINDHQRIRALYKKYHKLKVKVRYSISRDKSLKARERTELVIANYPLPKRW